MSAAMTAARRLLLGTTGGVSAFAAYKAKTDPPHIVWDLDNTLLCSVVTLLPPVGSTTTYTATDATASSSFFSYDYFEQIDDDFPFNDRTPNTRTFWRPGVKILLQVCGTFAVQHVYTTAQGTYTDNILAQLDPKRTIFHTVIHRDIAPASVKDGKDLTLIESIVHHRQQRKAVEEVLANNENNKDDVATTMAKFQKSKLEKPAGLLHRMILFDDRTKNFTPQKGENGVHVFPFQIETDPHLPPPSAVPAEDWFRESKEVARMVGISFLALLVPDVRSSLLPYFRSEEHNERFPAK